MPYRFQLNEPIEAAVHRICQAQIERAITSLKQANTPSLGVHEARKGIKKVRAVLKLIRSGIDKAFYQDTNIFLRDISRRLSGTRDAQVMSAILLKFKLHPELQAYRSLFNTIYQLIRHTQLTTEGQLQKTTAQQAITELEDAMTRFGILTFKQDPLETIFKGFEKQYFKAAHLMHYAYIRQETELFHDWRKAMQYHGRHLQLFFSAWPDLFKLKLAATRDISLILGEHNDLSVLVSFIDAHYKDFDVWNDLQNKNDLTKLMKIFSSHEQTLRLAARPRGARLFADTHKKLHHHLQVYWHTAHEIKPIQDTLLRTQDKNISVVETLQ